jgi:8-hydroxy-5-deazaflavin:NADPH oxidoreductase
MKIGIIGSGNIGGTAARLFAQAGHHVAISNSRGPESLRDVVAELGPNAQAMTAADAARFGDVVLVAVPLKNATELPADAFRGKIVVDANNYYPARDSHIEALDRDETTSSELLAKHLDGARVVKGFNSIWSEHLKVQGNTSLPAEERRVIPIAGDDAEAKQIVASLIESIGFGALDTGSLSEGGRRQQVGAKLYNNDVTVREARKLLSE